MYAMLTLDLNDTTQTQRTKFNESLKEEKWVKVSNLTTTWYASFEERISETDIMRITKSDVAVAAKKANIISYNAIVNISSSRPTTF